MRKITAGLFISLDGVVELPERWGFQYLNKEMGERIVAGIEKADAVLLGPATYRIFANLWPHQTDDVPMARFLNHSPKYVATRTPGKLGELAWGPAAVLEGDLTPALAKLRAQSGKAIQVPGSPRLVRSLLREGLLDELSLVICPVVVGSGLRLFDETSSPMSLSVEQAKMFNNGAISVTYSPVRSGDEATFPPQHFPAAAGRE
ncbi:MULTISPECIES: dihydrofolate reductase family protein [unclassified Rhizobium]|uniref:dihydrofolate reductase family protein n=1 Tax=unclassified Rhizobium TaxID=2613769 RepID=UPI000EAA9AD6|nr:MULTISPECIES: dihydrofolate reductase family protein [unclassified Rhizobium]AYG64931.1 deaminase [Rhizobium sp. CCGE531]AYG71416.1 deaminase [Rhizobium sp. CCGE532]